MGTYWSRTSCEDDLIVDASRLTELIVWAADVMGENNPKEYLQRMKRSGGKCRVILAEDDDDGLRIYGDGPYGWSHTLEELLEFCDPGSFLDIRTDEEDLFVRIEKTHSGDVIRTAASPLNPFVVGERDVFMDYIRLETQIVLEDLLDREGVDWSRDPEFLKEVYATAYDRSGELTEVIEGFVNDCRTEAIGKKLIDQQTREKHLHEELDRGIKIGSVAFGRGGRAEYEAHFKYLGDEMPSLDDLRRLQMSNATGETVQVGDALDVLLEKKAAGSDDGSWMGTFEAFIDDISSARDFDGIEQWTIINPAGPDIEYVSVDMFDGGRPHDGEFLFIHKSEDPEDPIPYMIAARIGDRYASDIGAVTMADVYNELEDLGAFQKETSGPATLTTPSAVKVKPSPQKPRDRAR